MHCNYRRAAHGRCACISGRQAFSLVELLVVIAIISMLMSIILPTVNKAREIAWRSECLSNVKEIARACSVYASNSSLNRGQLYALPNTGVTSSNWGTENPASLYLLIKHGISSKANFLCPHAQARQEMQEPDDSGFTSKTYCYSYMSQVPVAGSDGTFINDQDLGYPVIIADKNPRFTSTGGTVSGENGANSKNHERKGQNIAQINGSGRWLTKTIITDANVNDDIYQGGSGGARTKLSDSYVCP